jgi:hypothetical protein
MGWKMYAFSMFVGLVDIALIGAAIILWSWIPLAFLLAGLGSLPFVFARLFPLVPITPDRVFRERLLIGAVLGIVVAGTLISALVG